MRPVVSGYNVDPLCTSHWRYGSVPGMKNSFPITLLGQYADASMLVVTSICCVMMPAGIGQSRGAGLRLYTSFMNAVHAGAASTPPCAFDLIFCGLSKPIHTPATRSDV